MNKGFTLIEILGVVVILGLLMIIVAPPVINSVSKHETEVNAAQKQMIEDAADLYLDSTDSNSNCISIQTLKDAGYLNENFDDAGAGSLKDVKIKVTRIQKPRSFVIPGDC